jgi:hypothetical protein
MQHIQETNLAWSLIEAAKAQLDARERNHVFVSVGAGDAFSAIRILLKLIAIKQIPLPGWLAELCSRWLEAYVLHGDHRRLRSLIGDLAVTDTNPRSRAIARSMTCARKPVALTFSADGYHDRGAAPRSGKPVGLRESDLACSLTAVANPGRSQAR